MKLLEQFVRVSALCSLGLLHQVARRLADGIEGKPNFS